ncbi:hypothetical protein BB560_002388 [Smittium megazygosporum]|uniref:Protein-lysine N-methyltransferase EFM4 n=1 Tax=Smittium megazygosporum TaxID=133381 RepID=A0A2T9ZEW5_9FUNG|nr:hypothetical protein BB560_002388 [Smittium megazygosporum]
MDSNESNKDDLDQFDASVLGTKKYWDEFYDQEIDNYEDSKDPGEIWFGDMVESSVVKWMEKTFRERIEEPLIDIGCGNGHLLFELYESGFRNLIGTDYSECAINLAKKISVDQVSNPDDINFVASDVLDPACSDFLCSFLEKKQSPVFKESIKCHKYSFVLDKGTFDAISLKPKGEESLTNSSDLEERKKDIDYEARSKYAQTIHALLNSEKGVFVITSCNWTENELVDIFLPWFEKIGIIGHKTFTFGGVTGQVVSTVVFRPVNKC